MASSTSTDSRNSASFLAVIADCPGMIPAALPQFLTRQVDFTFRATVQNRIAFGNAFDPPPVHERIRGADIERIVTDGDFAGLPSWVAEMFRPVIKMINLHASPGHDLSAALAGRRQREDEKIPIRR